jgi:uncharacterized protein (DUF1330 family)
MTKGYWIAHADIADVAKYQDYIAANAEAFRKYGARFLVRGGQHEVREGASRKRHVVLEFPSYQAARDCYDSPEYQAALRHRLPVSVLDLVIVEGYDGPQPG